MLRCCLIHINIIILRQILYLVYLHPCSGLGLFMSYLWILFFASFLIFVAINHITSFKQMHLFSRKFFEYLLLFLNDNVDEEHEWFSNNKNSTSGCCLAFAWLFANFSLALLIKVLLIKKAYIYSINTEMLEVLGNSLKNTSKGVSKCKVYE